MSINLMDSFSEFKNIKSIDRPTMVRVLEDVFRTLIRKNMAVMIILTSLSVQLKEI